MKFIINKILDYMGQNAELDQELLAVYAYGLKILMEIALSVICTISIAILMGQFWEVLIIYVVIFPLRSYGGGFHFQRFEVCLMTSISFIVLILFIYRNTIIPDGVMLLLFCASAIYLILTGFTKEPGRDYTKKEERYYNIQLKTVVIMIIISVILLSLCRMYDLIRLIILTAFMLSLVKMAGDIKYEYYNEKRRRMGRDG